MGDESALPPPDGHAVDAPEAGQSGAGRVLRTRLLQRLLLPLIAFTVAVLMLSQAPYPVGSVLLIFCTIFVFPVLTFALLIISIISELQRLEDGARSGRVVALILAFTTAAIPLFAILLWRYSAIALSV